MEKSGVMHMRMEVLIGLRIRDVLVNGEKIEVVEEYRYLGCVINEQLNCTRMVEERARGNDGGDGDRRWSSVKARFGEKFKSWEEKG